MTPVGLERLIQIIVEELAAANAPRTPARCSCHSVLYECCPSRIAPVVQAGATRLGLHAVGGGAGDVAGMIDHTLLKPEATPAQIEQLCKEAVEHGFATVCVNGAWVQLAAGLVGGTGVGVAAVAGFPLGAGSSAAKAFEAADEVRAGATEVDMVINVGALKSGDLHTVERDIEAVTTPCRDCGALSKVIIEAALLTDDEKVTACTLAKAAGADYVKTSTGFGPGAQPRPTLR